MLFRKEISGTLRRHPIKTLISIKAAPENTIPLVYELQTELTREETFKTSHLEVSSKRESVASHQLGKLGDEVKFM